MPAGGGGFPIASGELKGERGGESVADEMEVLRVYGEARRAGVEGTPTVFINGEVYRLSTVDDFLRDVRALAGSDE